MSDFKVVDNSKVFKDALPPCIDKILEMWGIDTEASAKLQLESAPRRIDTGLLRNSITHAVSGGRTAIDDYRSDKVGGSGKYKRGNYRFRAPNDPDDQKAVYIGSNVEYAVYVHEGTQKMQPNRFLKNAVDKGRLKAIAEKELKAMAKELKDK